MMMILAILGAALGLAATGTAVWMAWSVWSAGRAGAAAAADGTGGAKPGLLPHLQAAVPRQWTYFDYMLLLLFLTGSMFLFTDLIAVLRDAELFPPYHYGYLLCGFVFSFTGMLMMAVRLFLVLSSGASGSVAPAENHQDQPGEREHAE
ncbi:hypothetical protein [Paenibacillus mucilaginosus]|uniref:hypothetical protein n=1 Tax=Paenibacillus mucilaginosus TaxID=61624 RepID=UPI0005A0A6D8|nr:hypothetical protein [Paenibacillus mucilaginosus]MCG7213407.1 hypothetical protein [Paenibacillus mucilaginosus]WDM29446.1 hypothetical protein KCX80_09930 [Paenibacillus mucilaginosus]